DAGLMVNPQDTEALAAAIGNVLGDASLRKQMAARGVQHAAKFSWKGTAAQVFSIYQRIHAEM
ncbi:MAG: glycosyltransferase family 1 protein, partial [Desulfovibrio sp.]|nr:glycosyltransferase family 1 protein [Desulfovibrio sp.]